MKKNIYSFVFAFILFTCFSCAIPAPPKCIKNNIMYGKQDGLFTGRWYDYYERALSYIQGECYQFAIEDLNRAIQSESKDERWVKTYGMHFMDYFPHREKGIILFILGDYDNAINELTLSIEQEKSAKAAFYLNKARLEKIKSQHMKSDIPKIKLNLNPNQLILSDTNLLTEFWTHDFPVNINGAVSDYQYVDSLLINQEPILLGVSQTYVAFNQSFELAQGVHNVEIVARNLMTLKAIKRVTIHVDRSGPVIAIEKYKPGNYISGYLFDDLDHMALFINNQKIDIHTEKNVSFSFKLNSNINQLTLKAIDQLGNHTSVIIDPAQYNMVQRKSLLTASTHLLLSDRFPFVSDVDLSQKKSKMFVQFDNLLDNDIVYKSNVPLKGIAHANDNIKQLIITCSHNEQDNGKIIYELMIEKPVTYLHFNHCLNLHLGKNFVQVKVIGFNDQEITKQITIQSVLPKVFLSEFRRPVLVDPLTNNGLTDAAYNFFQQRLFSSLNNWQRFQFFSIKQEDTNIMFIHSTKKNIAKLLFSGAIYSTDKWIEISATLTDISTSKKMLIHDVYDEFDQLTKSVLQVKSNELFNKFKKSLPIINAQLKRTVNDFQVYLPNHMIQMDWPIIIYQNDTDDPIRGSDSKILWHAKIDEKHDNGLFSIKAHHNQLFNDKAEWMITQ